MKTTEVQYQLSGNTYKWYMLPFLFKDLVELSTVHCVTA